MKITAVGYMRSVVGDHTLTNNELSVRQFKASDDGVEITVSRSNSLALSGHFSLKVHLSTTELNHALHSATIGKLERRIAELEALVRKS